MLGRERMLGFLNGRTTDMHPINLLVMQYACRLSGITYEEYCLNYKKQCEAMLYFAREYGLDCVHAAGYPWCEAMDYGLEVIYDGDLFPHPTEWLIQDVERDPAEVFVQGTPEQMREEVNKLFDRTNGKCIVAGGCEIPKNTPIENYRAFVETVRARKDL